ncbi:hypothetical protein ACINNAV21_1154 [Acinetobacter baumannii Naval-21]|nr:hypothetical protein ACIN5074_1231 [Acinetobacter baumannii OIFC074]EKP51682.1 hypothetical protein ACINNAV21_1154 [Acinetobacter baumannii Naval-21]KLT91937.1 hypothetical protein T633_2279 [Acinetobacter baumannii MRSN 58]
MSAGCRGPVLMSSENIMIRIEDLEKLPPEVVESIKETT